MDSLDRIRYTKFTFQQYVKLCNESQKLLLNPVIPKKERIEFLQLLAEVRVETISDEQEQELLKIREDLISQIERLNSNSIGFGK